MGQMASGYPKKRRAMFFFVFLGGCFVFFEFF